ncbi:MAG: site-2 protease family protein [Opitutae bacterium]|nr:site-2 protease family protein [Opitutae bacterium]
MNLFRIFGIQLAVHVSFVLLLAYYAYEGWSEGGLAGMTWNVGLILLFFGCVVLHELGHSLTARRYGVRVPRILLMPIGGMAEMDRIPRQPRAELLITIAGPAVNFGIVLLMAPFLWRDLLSEAPTTEPNLRALGVQLLAANAVMGVFNLLPVFPMDGGRIFRALLAIKLPYLRATYWAALIGKSLALVFALVAGLYWHHYLLAALFLFILFAADAEYKTVLRREQEAAYWAEMARRLATTPPADGNEPPAPPPLLFHGPN